MPSIKVEGDIKDGVAFKMALKSIEKMNPNLTKHVSLLKWVTN